MINDNWQQWTVFAAAAAAGHARLLYVADNKCPLVGSRSLARHSTSHVVTMTSRLAGAMFWLRVRRRQRRRRQPRATSATSTVLMMLAMVFITCDTGQPHRHLQHQWPSEKFFLNYWPIINFLLNLYSTATVSGQPRVNDDTYEFQKEQHSWKWVGLVVLSEFWVFMRAFLSQHCLFTAADYSWNYMLFLVYFINRPNWTRSGRHNTYGNPSLRVK